ncbi:MULTISPECIES: ATP-grasp fold amidoligase family protein [unclassified Acinetobacter]|uniref:ATP-grasp fold amidoligase family protein n=1 Tax=unclassified Acinetobacter TaxID=196816 RepID=UPI001C4B9CB0|nr:MULTISPECIES: ATP-grasp fold amidoligase family protein [unclassified Acinetobacter]
MNMKVILRKFQTFLNNPRILLIKILYLISPIFSDALYLKLLFPLKTGYKLNLNKPRTYNEKLQWLKIHYKTPVMTKMVDKFLAKEFARNIIGDDFIVKSYGTWNSFEEIDFNVLPKSFVLKTTHDQGGVIIVRDKNKLDKEYAKNKLSKHLNRQHYFLSREWPYKNVKPRIMAEALLIDNEVDDLYDYKFYCFDGEPKIMYIAHGRHTDTCYFDFYDMDFNKLDISRPGYPQSNQHFEIPANWELMKQLARKLSLGFPHLRVDFYNINGRVYLGELTFFQGGGLMPFQPEIWDKVLGDWIHLEKLSNFK